MTHPGRRVNPERSLMASAGAAPAVFPGAAGNVGPMSRRGALRIGAGAGAALLAGLSAPVRAACTTTGSQTEGPYWVDEMLNRSDIRSDPTSGVVQPGFPLRFSINVSEITAGVCSPLAGAYVDVWHCSALGVYSDTAAQGTVGQRYLRGYQATDAHGNARFLTVYPGYYQGRTVHIHFRVRKFSGAQVTFNFVSQLYFDDLLTDAIFARATPYNGRPPRQTRNANDGIFSAALIMRMADDVTHAVASFNAVVNATPGLADARATPLDPEAQEHAEDFGGGTPPLHLA